MAASGQETWTETSAGVPAVGGVGVFAGASVGLDELGVVEGAERHRRRTGADTSGVHGQRRATHRIPHPVVGSHRQQSQAQRCCRVMHRQWVGHDVRAIAGGLRHQAPGVGQLGAERGAASPAQAGRGGGPGETVRAGEGHHGGG